VGDVTRKVRDEEHEDAKILPQFSAINTGPPGNCANLPSFAASAQHNGFHPLPSSVINGVKTFVFFIGIGRSGHSIIASILDSHPHVIISNELNLFQILNKTQCTPNKSFIFNQIWNKSYTEAITSLKDQSKGYSLFIDGLYQGSYQPPFIDVIGDKMGGSTIALFLSSPTRFEHNLNKLQLLLNLPVKVFHVIRNPFDNIATRVLHIALKFHYSKFAMIKKNNTTLTIKQEIVDREIVRYFQFYEAAENVKEIFKIDTLEIHNKELITNPKAVINEMCEFLVIHCSDDYLDVVSSKVFSGESKTRYNIKWIDEQISLVKANIQKYKTLHRYLQTLYNLASHTSVRRQNKQNTAVYV